MARYWRTWRFRLVVALSAVSLIFLSLANPSDLRLLLAFMNPFNTPPIIISIIIVISLVAGIVAGVIQRSFLASGVVLLSTWIGVPIGRLVVGAAGTSIIKTMSAFFPFLLDGEGPGWKFAISLGTLFLGPVIGAIWGAIEGIALCRLGRRERVTEGR